LVVALGWRVDPEIRVRAENDRLGLLGEFEGSLIASGPVGPGVEPPDGHHRDTPSRSRVARNSRAARCAVVGF
jgi:hypothetical protein